MTPPRDFDISSSCPCRIICAGRSICMIKLLLWVWQLPQHLLAGLLMLWEFFVNRKLKQTIIKKNNDVIYFLIPNCNYGVSLGNYIFIDIKWSKEKTMLHEYGHSVQSRRFGWFYLLVVGIPSIIRNIYSRIFNKSNAWYYSGYPEKQADKLGGVKRN